MSDDITPTDDDLARDLRADLSELEGREGLRYEGYVCNNAPHAWPAAIRRALAAEAEAVRLRECLLWIASADWLLAWDLRALADEALSGAVPADFPRKRSDDA